MIPLTSAQCGLSTWRDTRGYTHCRVSRIQCEWIYAQIVHCETPLSGLCVCFFVGCAKHPRCWSRSKSVATTLQCMRVIFRIHFVWRAWWHNAHGANNIACMVQPKAAEHSKVFAMSFDRLSHALSTCTLDEFHQAEASRCEMCSYAIMKWFFCVRVSLCDMWMDAWNHLLVGRWMGMPLQWNEWSWCRCRQHERLQWFGNSNEILLMSQPRRLHSSGNGTTDWDYFQFHTMFRIHTYISPTHGSKRVPKYTDTHKHTATDKRLNYDDALYQQRKQWIRCCRLPMTGPTMDHRQNRQNPFRVVREHNKTLPELPYYIQVWSRRGTSSDLHLTCTSQLHTHTQTHTIALLTGTKNVDDGVCM